MAEGRTSVQIINSTEIDSIITSIALTRLLKEELPGKVILNPIMYPVGEVKNVDNHINTAVTCGFIPLIIGLPVEAMTFRKAAEFSESEEFTIPFYWSGLKSSVKYKDMIGFSSLLSVVTEGKISDALISAINAMCFKNADVNSVEKIKAELAELSSFFKESETEYTEKRLNTLVPVFGAYGVYRMLFNDLRKIKKLIAIPAVEKYIEIQNIRIKRCLSEKKVIKDNEDSDFISSTCIVTDKRLWKGDIDNLFYYDKKNENYVRYIIIKLAENGKAYEIEIKDKEGRAEETGVIISDIIGSDVSVHRKSADICSVNLPASKSDKKKIIDSIIVPALKERFERIQTAQCIEQ